MKSTYQTKQQRRADLPVVLMFYVWPFISIAAWLTGKGEVNYDYFWVPFLGLILLRRMFMNPRPMPRNHRHFLWGITTLIIIKYIIPWLYLNDINLKASIMDGKWYVYLLIAFLWVDTYGIPSVRRIYGGAVFFSMIYIAKALFMIATGELSRAGVLLEANYDGFMILMAYCLRFFVPDRKKWGDLILIVATVLTFSRTGIAALFIIWILEAIRKNVCLLMLILPIMFGMAFFAISIRGTESVGHLDRFVYWAQAFILFSQSELMDLLIGHTPGVALHVPILPDFSWTVDVMEEAKNLRGVYPFMFHSAYLRLAISWGIPIALGYMLFWILKYLRTSNKAFKDMCVLIVIQSFSLSTLTLPNVSLLLFLCLMLLFVYERTKTTSKLPI